MRGGDLVSFIHRPYDDDDYDEFLSGRRRGGGATEPAAVLIIFSVLTYDRAEDNADDREDYGEDFETETTRTWSSPGLPVSPSYFPGNERGRALACARSRNKSIKNRDGDVIAAALADRSRRRLRTALPCHSPLTTVYSRLWSMVFVVAVVFLLLYSLTVIIVIFRHRNYRSTALHTNLHVQLLSRSVVRYTIENQADRLLSFQSIPK